MNNFEANELPDPADLIRQYGPLVWKIVSAYLKNPDDIQECVNDIFCDLYLHRERYENYVQIYEEMRAAERH